MILETTGRWDIHQTWRLVYGLETRIIHSMLNTTGLTGAAPIWSAFMKEAVPYLTHDNPTPFRRPGGIVDKLICKVSGAEPADGCPDVRNEIFASDQLPLPSSKDFYASVTIDTWTGLLASGECQEYQKSVRALSVEDVVGAGNG